MSYSEMFAEVNGLHDKGFRRWLFANGMGFLDAGQWWGRKETRATPHEGVDFCLYETTDGGRGKLSAWAQVPAALDGEVACIHGDFLGRTVWIRHGEPDATGKILYSVYGHLVPGLSIAVGEQVVAGEIIGVVAEPSLIGKNIAPHLHLTVVRVIASIAPMRLGWALVQEPTLAELNDPLFI